MPVTQGFIEDAVGRHQTELRVREEELDAPCTKLCELREDLGAEPVRFPDARMEPDIDRRERDELVLRARERLSGGLGGTRRRERERRRRAPAERGSCSGDNV